MNTSLSIICSHVYDASAIWAKSDYQKKDTQEEKVQMRATENVEEIKMSVRFRGRPAFPLTSSYSVSLSLSGSSADPTH